MVLANAMGGTLIPEANATEHKCWLSDGAQARLGGGGGFISPSEAPDGFSGFATRLRASV